MPSWLRRPRLDLDEDDFTEEIRAHLAIDEAERVADGADREAARYAALREFGNVTLATEATRRVWTPGWLEALRDQLQDVRYAIRALAKTPMFSLTVIGVLALGIGLNAVVFTMLKGIALTPLAGVARSGSLVATYGETRGGRALRVSYPDYRYLRDHHRGYLDLFGTSLARLNVGRGRQARQIFAELVTGNYFQALGVRAQRGRTLLPADESAPGRHPVTVISDALWRGEFDRDADIVGRVVELNGYPFTIVGVADPSFHGTIAVNDVEAFIPITMIGEVGITGGLPPRTPSATVLADPQAAVLFPHGFLHSGTSLAAAAAETTALWSTLAVDRAASDQVTALRTVRFWQTPTGGQSFILPMLALLSATGLLVLLIACANIAGLVLVRGVSRRGEIAVRLALGATRTRIVRLLVVENLVLAIPGALLGVLVAARGIPIFVGYAEWLAAPERLFFNWGVDWLVIGFAASVGAACALVFGFVPALQSTRLNLMTVINRDAPTRGAARGRCRAALVVAQVAVSVLLLVGAGFATRSAAAARGADPGFDMAQVAVAALDLRQNAYAPDRGRGFYRRLLDAIRTSPGIESAALAADIPLGLIDTRATPVTIDGYEPGPDEDMAFMFNVVSPGYFRTLRIPVLVGREFEDRDDEHGAPGAMVNRAFADRFLGGPAAAVGRRIRLTGPGWRIVVGVSENLTYSRIDEPPRPYVYLPFSQSYRSGMVLHVRGTGTVPLDRLIEQMRAQVASLDADQPVLFARPMEEATRGAFIFFDVTAAMLFIFGLAGMALAALGTYALVSYVVRQSTHEIGIRLALGATRTTVVTGVARRGLALGAIGAGLGLAAAIVATRFASSLFFGVGPNDAAPFAGALAVVGGGVMLATMVPAWRAARMDALRALRHQ